MTKKTTTLIWIKNHDGKGTAVLSNSEFSLCDAIKLFQIWSVPPGEQAVLKRLPLRCNTGGWSRIRDYKHTPAQVPRWGSTERFGGYTTSVDWIYIAVRCGAAQVLSQYRALQLRVCKNWTCAKDEKDVWTQKGRDCSKDYFKKMHSKKPSMSVCLPECSAVY